MNDLTTELRRMADEAQQSRPPAAAEILQNGDRMRRRTFARRSVAGLSAVAAVAAVAVTVTAMQPGAAEAHPPSAQGTPPPVQPQHRPQHQQRVQLADWTVAMQADGNISLTIRQLGETASLQQTLRADGVPASALIEGQANPCHVYGTSDMPSVVTGFTVAGGSDSAAMIIHPSALPSGVGLQFVASPNFGEPGRSGDLTVRPVEVSSACTGS
ncbi:MAG TPA: hypothetical protein VG142_01380 [Trebonia sp.]|jgi:hypothetical protein|nr:hypothetical protein [Trebonia sp.]